jgi:GNAT superfamily N-acetyltransferase
MAGFSAAWLALREPADAAARSTRLAELVGRQLRGRPGVRAVDLGTGTGSNVRYLASRLPVPQDWLLVDDDEDTIDEAARLVPAATVRAVNLATAFETPGDGIVAGRTLVTASALLDLVSEAWLSALAARCRDEGAVVLFALTYDGGMRCEPEESDDETIRALVNRHQRRDKGFGAALGPAAADRAAECFARLGYYVEREPSPWVLTSDSAALQRQLIAGWAEAASEMAPERRSSIEAWRMRRLAHIDAGRSLITVGHADLAAWLEPPADQPPLKLRRSAEALAKAEAGRYRSEESGIRDGSTQKRASKPVKKCHGCPRRSQRCGPGGLGG